MDPVVLIARAVLLACLTVVLGATGHLSIAGQAPGPATLAVVLAAAFAVCLGLLRAPAGPGRIVTLLTGGQAVVQLALTASAGHQAGAGGPQRAVAGALALPVDHGRRVGSLQDSHDVATGYVHLSSLSVGHVASGVSQHAPLLALHLLVALAVGLALALGERCLWTLVALLSAAVLRLLAPVAVLIPARPTVRAAVPRRPRPLLLLARTVVRRGPPAVLGAA